VSAPNRSIVWLMSIVAITSAHNSPRRVAASIARPT
jgi:hypothetical protein